MIALSKESGSTAALGICSCFHRLIRGRMLDAMRIHIRWHGKTYSEQGACGHCLFWAKEAIGCFFVLLASYLHARITVSKNLKASQ